MGFLGKLLGGVVGGVGGFIVGGPAGAVGGAAKGLGLIGGGGGGRPVNGGIPTLALPGTPPIVGRPGLTLPPQFSIPTPTTTPQGQSCPPGFAPRITRRMFGPDVFECLPANGKQTGTAIQAKTNGLCCPSGFHLNKSSYFLKDGSFIERGTRCVRNRSLNPGNARALRRGLRREQAFVSLATRTGLVRLPKAQRLRKAARKR